jgi:4,5-DOPA dioxygenase extradiol
LQAALADEGVLIVDSGSLTHNLCEFRHGQTDETPCAHAFTGGVREAVQAGDGQRFVLVKLFRTR